ncbi:MAG TPA: hypothetical protein PKE57_08750, partial [Cellvibrionaceae bacterium]|nr:hypothetical protein [Cellvibrionaceae bacterium]
RAGELNALAITLKITCHAHAFGMRATETAMDLSVAGLNRIGEKSRGKLVWRKPPSHPRKRERERDNDECNSKVWKPGYAPR